MLTKSDFSDVIQNTPLISIDLIIENSEQKILLGKRLNQPAKDAWFVPGGRIFKDESLDAAFLRITKSEIGIALQRNEVAFYGLYEHFYSKNVFNDDFSTHYIVLAHKFQVNERVVILNDQHTAYAWFDRDTLVEQRDVHQYTKNYFLK